MDAADSAPQTKKGHTRNAPSADERRVSIPRRRTKGPLDFEENPPPTLTLTPTTPPSASPSPAPTDHLRHPPLFHPLPPPPLPTPMTTATPSTPLPTLLTSAQFRAAAISAAATLCDPAIPLSPQQVYALWHVRLSTLTLLGLSPTAAQEAKALSGAGAATDMPWELRVLVVRLHAVGWGDWRRCIAAYYDLGREARAAALSHPHPHPDHALWAARLAALGVRVASALVEMGDLAAAARHLSSLRRGPDDAALAAAQCLLWVRVGNVAAARAAVVQGSREAPVLAAVMEMAEGRYGAAEAAWRDAGDAAGELRAVGLAVALLYQGRLEEARAILEAAVDEGPLFAGLVFNLATVYELCSDGARALKRALAERVLGRAEVGAGAFKM